MEAEFIRIGPPARKEDFLQHIYDLHNVPVSKGDNYHQIFEKIVERFKDQPAYLEAVQDWIKFNKEEEQKASGNLEVFNNIAVEEDGHYLQFDFHNV